MRRKVCLAVVVACTGGLISLSATAESPWKVKPATKWMEYDDKRGLEEEEIGGSLGVEYQYGRWGTELQLGGNDAEVLATGDDVDVTVATVNQYLYFNHEGGFNPYFVLGAGHADFDGVSYKEKETQGNAGLGFQHWLGKKVGWFADVRAVHGFDDSATDTVATLGLTIRLADAARAAQTKPAPVVRAMAPPKQIDSDGDGVLDSADRCPGTKASVKVNARGCATDSDGDGVADTFDKCPGTLAGVKVDKRGCKLKVTRVEEQRLDVQFASNSSQLQENSLAEIGKLAAFMQKHRDLNVILEGHTDSAGDASYNMALSQKRAERVKAALVNRFGIAPVRITAKGYGEERPVTDNKTREGRAKNRRVIAALTKTITE
ncbi:MAG: OmpA family protein [Pseudomonadales bacterium]|nr:OmpA family protein [Pseudomonadales bacterium]